MAIRRIKTKMLVTRRRAGRRDCGGSRANIVARHKAHFATGQFHFAIPKRRPNQRDDCAVLQIFVGTAALLRSVKIKSSRFNRDGKGFSRGRRTPHGRIRFRASSQHYDCGHDASAFVFPSHARNRKAQCVRRPLLKRNKECLRRKPGAQSLETK